MLFPRVDVINLAVTCYCSPLMHPRSVDACCCQSLGMGAIGVVDYYVGGLCVELDASPASIRITTCGFDSWWDVICKKGHYTSSLKRRVVPGGSCA